MWADVPLTEGMNGFDVFLNATEILDLSYTASPTPPYGHTVQRVDNYSMQYNFANPAASGKVWHLWYWDSAKGEWSVSNTLLDGIDPTTTPAILLIYLQDPSPPPSLPLEHQPTVPNNSASEPGPTNESTSETPSGATENLSSVTSNFNYEVDDLNVTFQASSSNESAISNYTWNFGDGTMGEGESVEHNYSTGGNFTVTMTVVNQTGETKNVSQVVRLGAPALVQNEPIPTGGEGFPIWGWGLIGFVLIGGAELIYLEHKKLKRRR